MRAFFRRLFTQESSGIAASAFVIGAASLLSRLLGMIRDRLLAGHFGAGIELDAYYAAFRIPDTLFNLFIAGALSAGFIPLFSEYLEQRSEEEAWKLAAQVLTVLTTLMGIVAFIFFVVAPWVIPLFTHGFSPQGVQLTISMSRIMALSPILLGISGVMGAILQAKQRFTAFALAPVFYNLGIIIGIVFFAPVLGILGVAWGVALGSFLHACIQTWPAVQLGLRGVGCRPWWGEGVSRLFLLMIPRTASLAVTQLNLLIILSLASSLSVGSVAVFTLATNIQSLPFGLIGVSVAVAAFPVLSQTVNQGSQQAFSDVLRRQLAWLWFLLVPTTILFYLLAPAIIRVVLGTGKFDHEQIVRTAQVLRILVLALPAQSIVALFVRAFYAKKNTWKPFLVSLVAEGVNLVLCLWLRSKLGLEGLAIAFTVSTLANLVGLWMLLPQQRSLSKEAWWIRGRTFLGVSAGGIAMMTAGTVFLRILPLDAATAIGVMARSVLVALPLSFLYVGITLLLKIEEPQLFFRKIQAYFHK